VVLDLDDWEGWGGWNDVKSYPWIVKEYIDRQEKWLIRRVPVLTVASRALERRAVELRNSPTGVFYIPNGWSVRKTRVACESASPSSGDAARKLFELPDGPVIFYGGHFDPADDVLFFCRAAERAVRRFGVTLVFVGEGPELPKVKDFLARREGMNARFFPMLPHEQFLQLVAASDIAAFPYPDTPIYRAKCSARIVDYMSMGKPVVTTRIGQNIDYLVDGESGSLTAPGDASGFGQAIEELLVDPELRFRLGQNARKRIREKFSWDGAGVENCLAAYRQLSGFSSLGFWNKNARGELKGGEDHANLHRLGGRQAD
jgi:glycosyltransferase involved in cell wall biosynthesis